MPKSKERHYRRHHHDSDEDSDDKGGSPKGSGRDSSPDSSPGRHQTSHRKRKRDERGRERDDMKLRDRRHRSRSRSGDRHRRRSRSYSPKRSRRSDRRARSRDQGGFRRQSRSRSRSRSPNHSRTKHSRTITHPEPKVTEVTQDTKVAEIANPKVTDSVLDKVTEDCPNSTSTNYTSKDSVTSKSSPPHIVHQISQSIASEFIPIVDSAKPPSFPEPLPEDSKATQGETSGPVISKSEPENSTDGETSIEAVKAAQLKIEEEMLKRRQQLEAWRQKMLAEEKAQEDAMKERDSLDDSNKKMGWSLEDEEEDQLDENVVMDTEEVEIPVSTEVNETEYLEIGEDEMMEVVKDETKEDVDPLDAFMLGVNEEVNQIKKQVHKNARDKYSTNATDKKGSATVVSVIKISNKHVKGVNKGELLHNDQDAAEYSDEDYNENEELASALLSLAKKNKKKELPKVDHMKIEYSSFRKEFYVEVPELAKMTKEEVVAYRRELENIKVKGKDCPNPIKTFPQSGLTKKILDVMRKNNYQTPTPIQAQAIPAIMSGRDLIGIARTGSGKTLAFLLPMFRHILDQPPLDYDDGPLSLVMAPTRELAIQIYSECKKFCKNMKIRPVCVYGGTGISEQIADLKRGAEIIICTPGRMIDMLAANNGRVTNLRRITYVVLDEADRMFDLGFEPQVMKILENVRPDRQIVMFSATFPRQMEALARKILSKPVVVQVGGRSVVCKDVHQSVIVIDEHQKYFKLLELLGIYQEKGSILVFVERQGTADTLIRDLMKSSYTCMALHGGMDQFDRDSTIADFKNGVVKILVATSVAARGLDIKQLILVVNYDCPNHYEDYVHRCGRTGRAGNKGNAYTFITQDQQKISGDIIKALELSKGTVPSELIDLWTVYTDKLKAEGKFVEGKIFFKKKTRRAIGFGGSGYKFDEKEAVRDSEAKLKQKTALGLADDDDEDQYALLTMDKKLDEVFGGKVKVNDQNASNAIVAGRPALLPTPPQSERLDLAMAIADKIVQSRNLVGGGASMAAQEAASSIMKGGKVEISGAVLASQIAATINAKVGSSPANIKDAFLPVGATVPGQRPISGEIPDTPENELFLKFSDEVVINGFPQQIRFRLTTREVLDDIGEYSESYITVRGIYVPEARKPNDILGEKQLYLSIEAKTERAVQLAKQEIKRVIKEEAQHMASRTKPIQHTGRYSVV